MRASLLPLLATLALAACAGGDDPQGEPDGGEGEPDGGEGEADGGIDPDAGSPTGCAEPDTECPADAPTPSGPCEGALECDYLDQNGVDTWTFECAQGQWTADVECNLDGGCPTPPLAELCENPFTDTLEGAVVELGPPDVSQPFHALTVQDALPMVVGPQGGAMVSFRIAVTGVEAPACIGATIVATADGVEGPPQMTRVALHCGVSLPVFAILPSEYCEEGDFPLEIDLSILGVGEAHATVTFHSEGMCVG